MKPFLIAATTLFAGMVGLSLLLTLGLMTIVEAVEQDPLLTFAG